MQLLDGSASQIMSKKSVLYEIILAIPLKYGYCDIYRDVSGGDISLVGNDIAQLYLFVNLFL